MIVETNLIVDPHPFENYLDPPLGRYSNFYDCCLLMYGLMHMVSETII
jgi:hypothetical protein